MARSGPQTATIRIVTTTRRDALRTVGGGIALATLATASLRGRLLAQEATPAPDDAKLGLYVLTRTREVKPEKTAAELETLNASIQDGFAPLLREIPGFVEYYVVWNETTRERTAVNVFQDKAGADESTELAADYLAEQGLTDFYVDADPVITEGEIVVYAG